MTDNTPPDVADTAPQRPADAEAPPPADDAGKTPRIRAARERARARAQAAQEKAAAVAERAQVERSRHGSVDAAFEMADRDAEVGGGLLAGALAYRLFIWLLPLALVMIAGLGMASDTADVGPDDAAKSLGLTGLVTSSVAASAESSTRWYALLVGIPILLYATRGVLRALVIIHRLVWTDLRETAPRPTLSATASLLVWLILAIAASVLASTIRASSEGAGIIAILLLPLPYAALWVALARRLPHRDAPWQRLVPGALLVGFGVEALHAVTAYFIAPYAASKQGTYGALGTAAALLLGLALLSRLLVGSAVVNATLWDRHKREAHPAATSRPG